MGERVSKPVLAVLERCFAAEIDVSRPEACRIGQWPKVTKPLQRALNDGLVRAVETKMPATRESPFAVKLRGYVLTLAGHTAYCHSVTEADRG